MGRKDAMTAIMKLCNWRVVNSWLPSKDCRCYALLLSAYRFRNMRCRETDHC